MIPDAFAFLGEWNMNTDDLNTEGMTEKPALRVAWPFFFSTVAFWRNFKRTWPKTHGDVTRRDMVSIFGADLRASNDIMVKHCAAQAKAGH